MWHKGTIGAVVVAVLVGACSSTTEPASTIAAAPSTTSATTTIAVTTSTTTSPTTQTPSTTTTPATPGDDADIPWDIWTLIYASLDTSLNDREDAETIAGGLEGASVLLSDDYPSLNPGYWVVYAGEWHSRFDAGNWCPPSLDPGLSCYPRYLGDTVDNLLTASSAVMEFEDGLIIYDTATRETSRVVTDWFGHWDGSYPNSFSLDRVRGDLYFSRGYEDSWYSCDSERGSVEKLDLETGDSVKITDGWSTTISPDGRWLAIVAASQCVPDPEYDGWWFAPGDTVEIYDLETGAGSPRYSMSVPTQPLDYADPSQVGAVFWDGPTTLLVGMGDGSVRRIAIDSRTPLPEAPQVLQAVSGSEQAVLLRAVAADDYYLGEYLGEDGLTLMTADRESETIVDSRHVGDAWVNIAVNGEGEVLLTIDETLILPTGEEIILDGAVYNVAW